MTTDRSLRQTTLDGTPWTLIVLAAVGGVAGVVATSTYYRVDEWLGAPGLLAILGWQILVWAPWVLVARHLPVLAARHSFEERRGRDLGVHLLASVVLAGAHVGWFTAVSTFLSPLRGMEDTRFGVFKFFFVFFAQLDLLLYWVLMGLALAFVKQQALVEREARAAQLEVGLADARLQALQLQIRPHFLFNTLNTIVAMQRQGEVEKATAMTVALADMLRRLLVRDEEHEGTVEAELELVESYLEIESHRFGDRLKVVQEVDPEARELSVPTLSLQPLIENAIRHGVATISGEATVEIRIGREQDSLAVEIINSVDASAEPEPGLGIGLDNLRTRLAELYGEAGRLVLTEQGQRRTVRLEVPARTPGQEVHR